MHASYFLSRGRDKTFRRECSTCDEKRGEGKGKMNHQPSDEKWMRKPEKRTFCMADRVLANRNKSLSTQFRPFVCAQNEHNFGRPFFILGPMVHFHFPFPFFSSQVGHSFESFTSPPRQKYGACIVRSGDQKCSSEKLNLSIFQS